MAKKKRLKKGFKLYPLKKATRIGGKIKPIGYQIARTDDGYRFYKQQKIV